MSPVPGSDALDQGAVILRGVKARFPEIPPIHMVPVSVADVPLAQLMGQIMQQCPVCEAIRRVIDPCLEAVPQCGDPVGHFDALQGQVYLNLLVWDHAYGIRDGKPAHIVDLFKALQRPAATQDSR